MPDKFQEILDAVAVVSVKVDQLLAKESISINCPSCEGTGKRLHSTVNGEGNVGPETEEADCAQCNGTGEKIFGILKEV